MPFTRLVGRWLFRYRWLFYLVVFVPMALIRWNEIRHFTTWPVGIFLVFIGSSIRIYSAFYIGWKGRPDDPLKRTFTTSGPYRYTRNPLYWGNIIGFAGAAVLFKLLWYIPIAVSTIFLLHHLLIVWYEEERMREKYGESYEHYCKTVPRWGPKLSHLVPVGEDRQPFPILRVFLSELGTIAGLVGTIITALLKELYLSH
ncbi:MAG: isoprenylcysteine carboxylmethyltransferase family protein [Planctomycetota bacterium]|nr:isoprenylcysteine carboxylmethyltransferase family protein [Planctomycetota bacterium]MDI6786870.1 isoprenylcysteine carboxylmethyltransferase family protein [Planctomycetota bacterium]